MVLFLKAAVRFLENVWSQFFFYMDESPYNYKGSFSSGAHGDS